MKILDAKSLRLPLLCLLLSVQSFGQQRLRSIDWETPYQPQKGYLVIGDQNFETDYYAVEITEIRVGGKPVAAGRPFAAADDWLRGLALVVKNTSGRPIASFRVNIGLPETNQNDGRGYGSLMLGYRQTPNWDTDTSTGEALRPGGTVELRCAQGVCLKQLDSIRRWSKGALITRADLHSVSVDFDGRERWSSSYVPVPKGHSP